MFKIDIFEINIIALSFANFSIDDVRDYPGII